MGGLQPRERQIFELVAALNMINDWKKMFSNTN